MRSTKGLRRSGGRTGRRTGVGRRPAARAAFAASPDFFRRAIESLSEYALITMDRELRVTSWSGPAERMFGYAKREILGRSVSMLFTPEDIEAGIDRKEFRAALQKGREDDERWHVAKGGRRLWCYGLSFPLTDAAGALQGFVKLIRDDSERKAKDDALRENEERLRLAAESTGLGTWDYDPQKRRLMLSRRAAELFGLGPNPRSPSFEQFVERVADEDRGRVEASFLRCLAKGGCGESELEYRVRMPGGVTRWVRARARALYDGGARRRAAKRLLGTIVDVTESRVRRRKAEELRQELERMVAERTASLQAANRELETFMYSASHDLRAPLRKVSAFSQAILESSESRLSERDRDYFQRIRASSGVMLRLIDDILGLARVSRVPMARVECDLAAIARRVAGELAAAAPHRRVRLVAPETLSAEGDCGLLTIALRSLLDNAWKFTGGRDDARIEIGATEHEGRRVFYVKDNGAGFDMRFAGTLFGAFRRLHSVEEFPGTGIGLAMVERIVRRHHGRIWAEAEVGRGASFYFTSEGERS